MKILKNISRQVLLSKGHLATATLCIALGVATSMIVINSIGEYLRPVSPESRIDRILCMNRIKSEELKIQSTSIGAFSLGFAQRYLSSTKTQELSSIFRRGNFPRLEGVASKNLALISCDNNYWNIFDFEFKEGRPFTAEEFRGKANVAVVSQSLYSQLTDIERSTKKISYSGREFLIVGVVSDANSYRIFTNASLWIPYSIFNEVESGNEPTGSFEIVYLLKSGNDRDKLVKEVEALEHRYNASTGNGTHITVSRPRTKLMALVVGYAIVEKEAIIEFCFRYGGLVLIILLLPVLNLTILNYNHIKDRYAEMATMRSFGASKKDVVIYFMASNCLVVLIGGAVGYIFSFLFSRIHHVAVFDFERYADIPFSGQSYPSLLSFAFVVGLILIVSFISGIFPAVKLAKMNISTALKGGEQ